MVNIIDPNNWIDSLFPSKRQFITNTISKRLRFGIPNLKKKKIYITIIKIHKKRIVDTSNTN